MVAARAGGTAAAVVTNRALPAPPAGMVPAGQVYERPNRNAIRRQKSGRGTSIQVGAAGGRPPKVPVDQQPAGEVGWEKNPPHQPGLRVHRRNGSAQVQLVPVDLGVVDYLGREYFAPDGADAPAAPVCICGCGQVVPPGKPGKVTVDATHRRRASRRRARAADLLN